MVPTDHNPYAPHDGENSGSGTGSEYKSAEEANGVALGNIEQKQAASASDTLNVLDVAHRDYDDGSNAGVVGGVPVEGPAPGSGPEDEAEAAAEQEAQAAEEAAPPAAEAAAGDVVALQNSDVDVVAAESNATAVQDTITHERNATFGPNGEPVGEAAAEGEAPAETGDEGEGEGTVTPAAAAAEGGDAAPAEGEGTVTAADGGAADGSDDGSADDEAKAAKKAAKKAPAKKAAAKKA